MYLIFTRNCIPFSQLILLDIFCLQIHKDIYFSLCICHSLKRFHKGSDMMEHKDSRSLQFLLRCWHMFLDRERHIHQIPFRWDRQELRKIKVLINIRLPTKLDLTQAHFIVRDDARIEIDAWRSPKMLDLVSIPHFGAPRASSNKFSNAKPID